MGVSAQTLFAYRSKNTDGKTNHNLSEKKKQILNKNIRQTYTQKVHLEQNHGKKSILFFDFLNEVFS